MAAKRLRYQTQHNFYDFRRNVNKRVVSWFSDGEKKIKNRPNVIDCNIKLLGLNSKNLPAKRKKTIVCRMLSDTAH